MTDLSRAIEAVLFLSPEPVTVVTLCELTGESPGAVQQALTRLVARHGEESALEVAEVGDGYALRTQADLVEGSNSAHRHAVVKGKDSGGGFR